MCESCGCGGSGMNHHHGAHEHHHAHDHGHGHGHEHHHHGEGSGHEVPIMADALALNQRLADENRGFLRAKGIRMINVLSSPGSGKTELLTKTLAALEGSAAIVGDLQTDRDAERLRRSGRPAVQIQTGTMCHLDAHAISHALDELLAQAGGAEIRTLFVENVGNLVCPAAFDLGETARVTCLSVTEGEDKPLKYPRAFLSADAIVLTKMDLAGPCGFDRDMALDNIRHVNSKAPVFEVSARDGRGMDEWLKWVRG